MHASRQRQLDNILKVKTTNFNSFMANEFIMETNMEIEDVAMGFHQS